jgi:hypothetical protein
MKSRRKLPRLAILTRLVEAVPHTIEHRIRLQRSLETLGGLQDRPSPRSRSLILLGPRMLAFLFAR